MNHPKLTTSLELPSFVCPECENEYVALLIGRTEDEYGEERIDSLSMHDLFDLYCPFGHKVEWQGRLTSFGVRGE